MKWHYATWDIPAYVLTVAPGGSKLRRSKEKSCRSFNFTTYPNRKVTGKCGAVAAVNMRLNMQLDPVGMKIDPGLVQFLSFTVDRPVIEKTGLIGRYDFQFEWNVAATQKALGEPGAAPGADSPTIFTALLQQLGLQLKPGKGPMKVLIVDHAEKPELDQSAAR